MMRLLKPLRVAAAVGRHDDGRQSGHPHLTAVRVAGKLERESGRRLVRIVRLMNQQELESVWRHSSHRYRGILEAVASLLQAYHPKVGVRNPRGLISQYLK